MIFWAGSNRFVRLACEPAAFFLVRREVVVGCMGPLGVVFGNVGGHGVFELAYRPVASSVELLGLHGLEERLACRVVVWVVGF